MLASPIIIILTTGIQISSCTLSPYGRYLVAGDCGYVINWETEGKNGLGMVRAFCFCCAVQSMTFFAVILPSMGVDRGIESQTSSLSTERQIYSMST